MTTGIKTFSSEGREVKKVEFTPPPVKDWDARLMLENLKIAVAQGVGKLPYIDVHIELLNSAIREGGKNLRLFHKFFVDLTPSDKDGAAMVDRQNGLVAFSKSVNTALNCDVVTKTKKNDDGTEKECEILEPDSVKRWLKQFDGVVFKLKSKIEKGTAGYSDKGAVDYFIEAEPA